ncbi:MAG: hypothetical protein O2960_30215 [Verrucomicrobia bacterium]|nr:hypothetical protein [Verrucomicrobiota bacterium]
MCRQQFATIADALKHRKRAEYGKQVIPKLAEVLGLSERLLYRMARIFEAFPILTARSELSWTHYCTRSQIGVL